MIDPVTGWFEVVRYDDKRQITIANLVETMWLSRYPRPIEITYDQGRDFIDHEFRKFLIEYEYGITAKKKHFRKYHVQCYIGTDSLGSMKPSEQN